MKYKHIIINGDCRNMEYLKNESVHLVITSPPYWQLKDYGNSNQIGFNENYETYINNLNLVWKESYRVLNPGCRLCINIGDQYARSVYYGRYKVIPIRTEIIKYCETIGFDYMGAIIWQKVTNTNTTGGATIMGSFPYPRNGILKLDYEFILIFKKIGTAPKVSNRNKELSILSTEEWNLYFQGHWNFAGTKQNSHIAMFPEELPKRLIKMFSFMGDVVLDPFLGSGTTSLAAKNLNRNSIGYEINPDYTPVIKEKLSVKISENNKDHSFEFLKRRNPKINFDEEINLQPYIFKDPLKLDNLIDPKKTKYGSKLDKNKSKREVYYSVKEIISSEIIKLNNNMVVRLIGVKENKKIKGAAINFLILKLKGNKIFLKYDSEKYDENNRLLCYLYLQNKTFINAHLIKNRLADVELSKEYKYKSKFITLSKKK